MSVRRSTCCAVSSTGLPHTCTSACAPRPNQLFFSFAFTRRLISSRSPDAATVARWIVTSTGPLLSSGNVFPLSCSSISLFTSVNGRSTGTPTETRPCSIGGTISTVAGNGQSGLLSAGEMRVSACTPMVSVTAAASIFGCAATARTGRTSSHRSGMPAAALPSGIDRHIFAHSRRATCSMSGSLRNRACSAFTCSADRAVEQRLHLARQIELHRRDREIGVADHRLAGEIGIEPPVRRQRRARGEQDVAAHVGALVERAAGQVAHLLAELFVQQAAERAGDVADLIADLRADLAGEAERAVERRHDGQAFRASGDRERPARHGPAELGVLQQLPDRVLALAGEVARRLRLERIADRRERDRGRRDHDGGARRGLERRTVGQRRPPLGRGRREPVHREQRRAERDGDHDRDDQPPEQNLAHARC